MRTGILIALSTILASFLCSCQSLKEEDKVFHAGPVESGFGVIYFGLYKGNKYKFCDGDFMNDGCYTGDYSLSGDTITLHGLRKHNSIPSNRFLIRRYKDMDSTYWEWKYPQNKSFWNDMRQSDSLRGAEGDIIPLGESASVFPEKNAYFLIRFDELKNNH